MRERRVACNVMGTFILLSTQRAAHRADDDEDRTGAGEFVERVHGDQGRVVEGEQPHHADSDQRRQGDECAHARGFHAL